MFWVRRRQENCTAAAAALAGGGGGVGVGGNFKENCLNQKTMVCVGAANVTTVKRLSDISV